MEKGSYVAVSGSMAQERAMEIIANNMANIATSGFKADRLVFEAHLQKNLDAKADVPNPEEIRDGHFSKRIHDSTYLVSPKSYTDFSQGPLRSTPNPLDIALQGDGFMVVKAEDGIRYTRGGVFEINQQGELVTGDGLQLLDKNNKPIQIGNKSIIIQTGGRIFTEDNEPIADIQVVKFQDKGLLEKRGSGLYESSKPEMAEDSDALVRQSFLEGSNINPVSEMTKMITVLRAYETLQKAIQSEDEMTGRLISDVGRS